MNDIILLVLVGISVPLVFIGTPYAFVWLYKTSNKEKGRLSFKVAQIKLLPKVRYMKSVHKSMTFCTICMSQFSNANSYITYLPCDARHYFHSKCIRFWLLGKF